MIVYDVVLTVKACEEQIRKKFKYLFYTMPHKNDLIEAIQSGPPDHMDLFLTAVKHCIIPANIIETYNFHCVADLIIGDEFYKQSSIDITIVPRLFAKQVFNGQERDDSQH